MQERRSVAIHQQAHIPFLEQKVIYSIFAQHTPLADLISLAKTSRRANELYTEYHGIASKNPRLLLQRLTELSRARIFRYLAKYPAIMHQVEDMVRTAPDNHAVYALWALLIADLSQLDISIIVECISLFYGSAKRSMECLHSILIFAAMVQADAQKGLSSQINSSAMFAHQSSCYLNLRGLKFGEVIHNPRTTNITNVKLSYASLKFAKMRGIILENVSLYGADLTGVDFTDAFFQHVDLRFTNLEGAIFRSTIPTGSNFKRMRLDGAKIMGARFFKEDLQELLNAIIYILHGLPQLNETIHDSQQAVINYKVLMPAVLHDLIFTVSSYHNNQLDPEEMKNLKVNILMQAQNHFFFKTHESKARAWLDAVLRTNVHRNSIFTPAQKIIQNEINRINKEYAMMMKMRRL